MVRGNGSPHDAPGRGAARPGSASARNGSLLIGDLASRTGVTVEALRYYERRGLLHPSARRESGYREYAPDAVRLVRFIKRAQALRFTLAETAELVHLREQAWAGDAMWLLREATVAKVRDIDRRARELAALRHELSALIAACDTACSVAARADKRRAAGHESRDQAAKRSPGSARDCPIVVALDNEPGNGRRRTASLLEAGAPKTRESGSPATARRGVQVARSRGASH
jgi:DNA-binding transcriptional MerR regulator